MWPEILPPFCIIVGSLYLTSFLIGQIDKFEYGGKVNNLLNVVVALMLDSIIALN